MSKDEKTSTCSKHVWKNKFGNIYFKISQAEICRDTTYKSIADRHKKTMYHTDICLPQSLH